MSSMNYFEDDQICIYELCKLVDCLVKDIMHLESEVVKTRYELSQHLKHPYANFLRSDILSDLAGRYDSNPAYQFVVELIYGNQNPLESDEWLTRIQNLANGAEDGN